MPASPSHDDLHIEVDEAVIGSGLDAAEEEEEQFEVFETVDDQPMKIQPGLYIGSALAAQNLTALQKAGISHILQVASHLSPSHPASFVYKVIRVEDLEWVDIVVHFAECFAFIDKGIAAGGVLVHCLAGISRSAAVCIGYLMWKEHLSYDVAFRRVHEQRPWIMPNEGFQVQLSRFERLKWDLSKWGSWTFKSSDFHDS